MLASGGRYIDQLYQKMYDSEPLPFTLKRKQYSLGQNEIIPFYDVGIKGYVELKDILDFIRSDDPETFLTLQNGEKIKFIPSRNIKLTVDKEACLRNGIVPAYLKDKMVDTIYWTIRGNEVYKNDIMLLDFVASNKWTRPLYFSAPGSVNHVFNLDHYCLLCGYAYKFMPVKADTSDYIQGMGGVDPLTSYDILMNKCKWGNLNDPHVYVDPESLNNAVRPRTSFMRVAQSLVDMGKNKEASELLDTYLKYFPDSKISYDMFMLPFSEIYYRIGDTAKANRIMKRVAEIFSQNLDYYLSYPPDYRQYFQNDINNNFGMIRRISMIAKDFKQDKLVAEMDRLFTGKIKSYK
jgi:tetratricopeptide (TPR) repeat protein